MRLVIPTALLTLAACAKPPTTTVHHIPATPDHLIVSEPSHELVEVHYATDREVVGTGVDRYGSTPRCPVTEAGLVASEALSADCVERGVAWVSIPASHERGELESPSWLRFEFRPDPEKHVVLDSVEAVDRSTWTGGLQAALASTQDRHLLVFIHGYNVDFSEAVRRTAQLAVDLPINGAAVTWSWASAGTLAGYGGDEQRVLATIPHLAAFLSELADESGADRIHVLAHSMGNRALTGALLTLAGDDTPPRLDTVMLAAPDIDAEVFRTRIAPRIVPLAQRTALYASAGDRALDASQVLAKGKPRAGDVPVGGPVVVAGVETIDASAVDTDFLGHSYVAQASALLDDVLAQMNGIGAGPERPWVRPAEGWLEIAPTP